MVRQDKPFRSVVEGRALLQGCNLGAHGQAQPPPFLDDGLNPSGVGSKTMKYGLYALVLGAGLGMAGAAAAEPWVDWTPQKGATEVITLKVDPNHIDDYLTGLKKTWVVGQEMAKAHGVIDSYDVVVKLNGQGGANVALITHYPSLANLDPDKARDLALRDEGRKALSDADARKMIDGYDKYREFVSDDIWTSVQYTK
jgi:hypothetical protein